jgi:hypothetical protein
MSAAAPKLAKTSARDVRTEDDVRVVFMEFLVSEVKIAKDDL